MVVKINLFVLNQFLINSNSFACANNRRRRSAGQKGKKFHESQPGCLVTQSHCQIRLIRHDPIMNSRFFNTWVTRCHMLECHTPSPASLSNYPVIFFWLLLLIWISGYTIVRFPSAQLITPIDWGNSIDALLPDPHRHPLTRWELDWDGAHPPTLSMKWTTRSSASSSCFFPPLGFIWCCNRIVVLVGFLRIDQRVIVPFKPSHDKHLIWLAEWMTIEWLSSHFQSADEKVCEREDRKQMNNPTQRWIDSTIK